MIQRKQSIWLLIAALLNAGVFIFDFYRYHTMEAGVDVSHGLRIGTSYPLLLMNVVMTLLPLVAIFMYGDRKRQLRMSVFTVVITCSFIALSLNWVTRELNKIVPAPANGNYWIAAVLPAASMIFLVLAILGIRRDEKLVKSVDRLR